jgi:hypothetical protein
MFATSRPRTSALVSRTDIVRATSAATTAAWRVRHDDDGDDGDDDDGASPLKVVILASAPQHALRWMWFSLGSKRWTL